MASSNNHPVSADSTNDFPIICDPIGFQQHIGECWSDSILQAFAFSDLTNDIMQPALYNYNNNASKEDQLISHYAKRFRFHYDYISDLMQSAPKINNEATIMDFLLKYKSLLKNTNMPNSSVCPLLRDKAKLKRRMSANLGPAIARTAQSLIRGTATNNYVPGGNYRKDIPALIDILNNRFRLGLYAKYLFDKDDINTFKSTMSNVNNNCIYILSGNYKGDTENHTVAIYKCNNKLIYYDDNVGTCELHIDELLSRAIRGALGNDVQESDMFNVAFKYLIDKKGAIVPVGLDAYIMSNSRLSEYEAGLAGAAPSNAFILTGIMVALYKPSAGGYKKRSKSRRKTRRHNRK